MQAEEELATLPQLATEDMFITEHFFIEISTDGIAFVPIQEIIWLYKHSTLHKFFWYHFSIRTRRFILVYLPTDALQVFCEILVIFLRRF